MNPLHLPRTLLVVAVLVHAGASHARMTLPGEGNADGGGKPLSRPAADNATDAPEAVVIALYDHLSFVSGERMDRNRVRPLFAPDARIVFAGRRPDGSPGARTFSLETFLDFATPVGDTASRQEKELWRRVERFGNIAHVFSAYELSFTTDGASEPVVRRGVNSVQLRHDGSTWRIVSLLWDVESAATRSD